MGVFPLFQRKMDYMLKPTKFSGKIPICPWQTLQLNLHPIHIQQDIHVKYTLKYTLQIKQY